MDLILQGDSNLLTRMYKVHYEEAQSALRANQVTPRIAHRQANALGFS